ncbi:sperm flagellar protein 1-like [Dama dama]
MLNTARPRPRAPPPLPPGALHGLYAWLDALPLSRRKRHLARDFSDGVMLAEVVKLFRPRLVDLHNYVPTCNTGQKRSNWNVLNRKVFHKLGLSVSEEEIRKVVVNTPGAIEPILCAVRDKVEAGEDPPGTAGHKRSGPGCAASSREHVPLPICDGETPAGLRTRIGCPAGEPWHHLDPGLPQQLLEEKEQALAVLQETIKVLQMKVARLEHLVKLKDQRIGVLMRQGDQPRGGDQFGYEEGPSSLEPLSCPGVTVNAEHLWAVVCWGVRGGGSVASQPTCRPGGPAETARGRLCFLKGTCGDLTVVIRHSQSALLAPEALGVNRARTRRTGSPQCMWGPGPGVGRGSRPLGLSSLLRKRCGGAREATPSPPRSAPGWSKHAPCGQGRNHALLTLLKKARGCDEGLEPS